jgi:hypothetical protein
MGPRHPTGVMKARMYMGCRGPYNPPGPTPEVFVFVMCSYSLLFINYQIIFKPLAVGLQPV